MRTVHPVVITGMERRRNSKNGNPNWVIHFTDSGQERSMRTGTDASIGLMITESIIGAEVSLIIHDHRIIDIDPCA